METGVKAKTIWGDSLYQVRARKAFPILVRQAVAHQPIYYSDLSQELEMPNPRNLNYVLASIDKTLQVISEKWEFDIPAIGCLVINQNTLIPGSGVGVFIRDVSNFANLSETHKRKIIDVELQKIFTFPRWQDILEYLELD